MLNITRIHNSLGATGAVARGLAYARAYARVREAFGSSLSKLPAHRATLTDMAVDHAACLALTMRCCELMGKVEHGSAGEDEASLLRGLTPLTKLSTGRWSIAAVTEAMEAIGGVGYCEDSRMPALVRNTHVIPIWEGTTNVMALDFLRASVRSDALSILLGDARQRLGRASHPSVAAPVRTALAACDELEARAAFETQEQAAAQARSLAMSLAATYACALLCDQGSWAAGRGDLRTAATATRLAARGLLAPPAPAPGELALGMDEELSSL